MSESVVWRRHARARRVSLRIDPGLGRVIVTLPLRAARAEGLALLAQHAQWVSSRLAALPEVTGFADGAAVAIDGVAHIIRQVAGVRGVSVGSGEVRVGGPPAFLARRVMVFLRAEAGVRFSALARAKALAAGLVPSGVTVRDTRTRWGSCSPDGRLMFCWRLLMAPPFVQDYVVAHEVAHLRHLDHSARFWELAESLSPHRDAATQWLEHEGPRLLRVG